MFEKLKAKLCCLHEDYQININIELMNCKGFAKSQKNFAPSDTQKNKNKISASREILVDFSDYSFYLMITFNGGSMNYSSDFLYIREEKQLLPQKIEQLSPNSMIPISENKFNDAQACAHLSLANIDPGKTYLIHYLRKNTTKNTVNSLYQTKRFKLSFKNKMHNLFLNSINPLHEEFTVIYENDPLFDRFDPSEIIKNHRRSLSFAYTGEINHSFKTRGSSKDSRFEEKPRTQGHHTGKNSLYNTFISASDFPQPPMHSGNNTNKNSFAGEFYSNGKNLKFDYLKSIPPIPEQRTNFDNQDIHASQVEFNSETMIIHDQGENDDYIKRMCIILAENLESTFPPATESKEAPTPLEKSGKIQIDKSKRPSLEHSKIFELLKSQERKDFSLSSTTNFKVGSPDPKANINISPESIKKEFRIGSSSKKLNLEVARANTSKVEKNIIALLEEIDKDGDSKRNSPSKEVYAKNHLKNSIDLENLNAEFNGIEIHGIAKAQRKPLQDISNKALEFATAESQTYRTTSQTNRFNNIITSEDSEKNLQVQFTDSSDGKDNKENRAPADISKITFRKQHSEPSMKLQLENEIDLHCSEDLKITPRCYNDYDMKTYFSPNYTDRLHTVEEVCSSSKESSFGGDYYMRFQNRSTSKKDQPLTSSVRAFTEQPGYVVDETDEFHDEVRISIPPGTERSFSKDNDSPIELMILKKKLDDIGMRTNFNPMDRLITITDAEDVSQKFVFRWYEEISEKDLNLYFREIVENVQDYKKYK